MLGKRKNMINNLINTHFKQRKPIYIFFKQVHFQININSLIVSSFYKLFLILPFLFSKSTLRSKEEYETACVKNSLYAHFIGGRVNEVVLAYLEKKSSKLTNFDSFSKSPSNELMSLIVIVFNYEK